MITLDLEFVGTLAPPSKLTKTIDGNINLPFARLPRHERLKVEDKAYETEEISEEGSREDEETAAQKREEEGKEMMRGRGKALKRYLRKQRKNDPRAVAVRAKLEKEMQRCCDGRRRKQVVKRLGYFPTSEASRDSI